MENYDKKEKSRNFLIRMTDPGKIFLLFSFVPFFLLFSQPQQDLSVFLRSYPAKSHFYFETTILFYHASPSSSLRSLWYREAFSLRFHFDRFGIFAFRTSNIFPNTSTTSQKLSRISFLYLLITVRISAASLSSGSLIRFLLQAVSNRCRFT